MLNTDYGTVDYDNLINRPGDVGSIQLEAGQGTLERGSVIDNNGKLLDEAEAQVVATYAVTADTVYDSDKTYYTESNGVYTEANIDAFVTGTTYYEKIEGVEVRKAAYILCDETETDDTETVTGIVYKNGNFVKDSLVVATGYSLTDSDVDDLRHVGIIIEAAK